MRQWNTDKCSQWYFTIDGEQCTDPAPVNGILCYGGHRICFHRHSTIIGVCRRTDAGDIHAGTHQIAMHVGNCQFAPPEFNGGDAHTGWLSTTTMLVEELCPPQ